MTKKVRVSAETLPELRDFLSGAKVDMGCRPVAVKRGDRFATTVVSGDDELDRLSARRVRQRADRGARGSAQPGGPPADGARGQPVRRRPGAARPRGEGVGDELSELRRDRDGRAGARRHLWRDIAGWSSCRTRASRGARCWRSNSATRAMPNGRRSIYVGGVHAREWIPPDALLYFCADLLEARSGRRRPELRRARGSRPTRSAGSSTGCGSSSCPAPTRTAGSTARTVDPDWRKNRAASADGGCVGVDINRNFDVAWDFRRTFAPDSVSASDDPCHKYVYVGPAAASEPETRNIVWLLDQYPGTQWFLDVHGAVPAVFHNWGLDENAERRSRPELPQPERSMASAGSPGTAPIASSSMPRTRWSCAGCRS